MERIRARLIYNPTSGREEIRRRLPLILQRLEKGGIETSCHATEAKGDAILAASEAIERGFDLIIAAGGDGTLNEVVNGISGHERRPALGVLPMGTSNDFARALGIPKRWQNAVDLIVRGHSKPVDLGIADGKYFMNIAGGGFLTDLSYEVPSKLKTMIGQLAYYVKGFEKIVNFRPTRLKLSAEGVGDFEGEFMLFLIANTHTVAGFEKLAPQAKTDDGMFDVLLMKKCNLAEMIRLASMAVMRGDHLNDSHMIYFQTNKLSVETDDRVQLNLDGELGGELPCSFQVLPAHIRVLVDENGESSYRR
ncbi:diacylglycerol kinase [Cohnella lubricantis]|uniref:Diacylglycerol kinase n=1 Tax=Cohnella lubricantis TaxID=2163172 RepID=A0A841T877_9BACL|nr:diacylglycerol kinase [Cohnella lubricantis]MBB6676289.1 diacylglycerol kinase [Cohnella lubricantis]MBP2117319.1 diacylglycerol kinase (ATP) [Cohnella lubricantis]